jgi:hypothetical protein
MHQVCQWLVFCLALVRQTVLQSEDGTLDREYRYGLRLVLRLSPLVASSTVTCREAPRCYPFPDPLLLSI